MSYRTLSYYGADEKYGGEKRTRVACGFRDADEWKDRNAIEFQSIVAR